ncbi:MAG TPA: FAD-dependent oxidoreductase [Micromonosporaceae bacterium]|nr:FAD-dependent oxidoreductase [Micromonosporaceae bacterium]
MSITPSAAGPASTDSPAAGVPASARAVIIGGGVAGCSIAYHLARLGWTDIVLVERHALTEGTTWHSAGFVGQLRSTVSQTRMIMYSSTLYPELRERTGLDPGWHGVGGLRLATATERVDELRRQARAATTYGLEMHLLNAAETAARLPLLHTGDILAAGWLPGDGYLQPAPLAEALAAGARALGATIATATAVTGIEVSAGRVRAVRTDRGRIATDVVVNAAGAAAGHVGRMAGVAVPVVPMKHQYVVSTAMTAPMTDIPTVRDPDAIVYLRGEGDALLVGGYVRDPRTCWPDRDRAPLGAARQLFEPDPAQFDDAWSAARRRVPALREAAIARVVHGPEAFTPDGEFLLGEAAVGGFWVAAGFCVHGLAAAGGVGKVMAEWIVDGVPEWDMSTMDIRRFGAHAASRSWTTARALDGYSRYYDVGYPHQEATAGRPLRRSATWPRLAELGADVGEKAGWERVNWFGATAADFFAATPRPRGWAGRTWSPAIEAECRATTEAAGLFDQSSFAKLDIRGDGAVAFLDTVCAGRIDRPTGTVIYTQLLNARGGIEADVTVTRLADTHFRIVTSTASGVRDAAWLRRHAPAAVTVDDVTSAYGCLCVWGPAARHILQPLTGTGLGNADFRYLSAQPTTVGDVPVLAQRVTFVGELGWELYPPTEYTLTLWDTLLAAGRPLGLRPGGYRAIDSMRLEKGYRVWGADLTTETTPDEAGLSFAVSMDKPDFIGRRALAATRAAGGPARSLRCLVLDDDAVVCLGGEPVRVNGEPAGRVTSGGYGHRVGASIAYAYLPATVGPGTAVEVGAPDAWVAATVRVAPLFDPESARVRA